MINWTDSELWKLQRALDLYERQIKLIFLCEDWQDRTYASLDHAARRTISGWTCPENTFKLPLNIEERPEAVFEKVQQYCSNPASRSYIPKMLLSFVKERPIEDDDEKVETVKETSRLERKIIALQDELGEAKKKLVHLHREESLFERLAETIRVSVPPYPSGKTRIDKSYSKEATSVDAVLLLSDEHADSVISTAGTWGLEYYDFNIFRCRACRLVNTIKKYVSVHLPMHKFDRLWIFKLGDALQGDIHNASLKNHFQNTIKAALATGDVEAQMVQHLVPFFPGGVHVIGVPGNHTRRLLAGTKKNYNDPHDNFDYLVMTQMATRLQDEIREGTVSVICPDSFTAYVEVRGKIWSLNHGDEVRGFAGHPWYGFSRRNNRVQALVARKDMRVKYFCYGHYHTQVEMQEADSESLHAGNWTLTDHYAIDSLAAGSEPIQPLYVVDDKYGRVMSIPIYIRDDEAEAEYLEGRWTPFLGDELILDYVTPRTDGIALIKHENRN